MNGSGRLADQLAAMVALEDSVEVRTSRLLDGGIEHHGAASLLARVRDASRDRRSALASRMAVVAPEARAADPVETPSLLEALYAGEGHPASAALLAAHASLSQALMGYAVLLVLAFRAADSVEHLGPDNTGDLAWAHMQACAAQAKEIARLMPYVVVDELEDDGLECRCTCPTCGLGVCGCPLAFRRRLDLATAEAGPIEDWPGITMVRPRAGSPAALAGIGKGDVLTTIDGTVLDSIPGLQEAIKARGSGEEIRFEVRRPTGACETVAVVRP